MQPSTNQSINQSISQSVNQSVIIRVTTNRAINQSINQSVSQPIDIKFKVTGWLNWQSIDSTSKEEIQVRIPSGAQEQIVSFFRVKSVVLTRCRCAQPRCVHARIRMITYARYRSCSPCLNPVDYVNTKTLHTVKQQLGSAVLWLLAVSWDSTPCIAFGTSQFFSLI